MVPKGRLKELDCLRGVAVLAVVLCHFTLSSNLSGYGFKFGATGVELFFMISGFVIFFTVEHTATYKDFLVSRFARLFPAYWVCVSITAAVIVAYTYFTNQALIFPHLKDYLINLTMLQDFFRIKAIDGVYWSLTTELMFYFFISVLFMVKKLNKIELAGYIVIAVCLMDKLVFKQHIPFIYQFFANYFSIIYNFPLFFAGIMFYKIKFHKATYSRVILILFCYATQVFLWEHIGGHVLETHFQYALILLLYFALFALFYFDVLHFIVNRVLLFFGKISYPLYLIHNFIFAGLLIPILTYSKRFQINQYVVIFLIALPLAIILATFISKFVEVPARRYIKRIYEKINNPISS